MALAGVDVFYRQLYQQLAVTLTSNEVLGVLDSGFLEDYFGTDGQVTLHHLPSDQRFALLMGESPNEAAPHEVFVGQDDLSLLPDGEYRIEGRVRDVVGNYTILSAFAAPRGDEQTLTLAFSIIERVASGILIVLPAVPALKLGLPPAASALPLRAVAQRFVLVPSPRSFVLNPVADGVEQL